MSLRIVRNAITGIQNQDHIQEMVQSYNGKSPDEDQIRTYYRQHIQQAVKQQLHSLFLPLIKCETTEYPKEEGMRIAVDEIRTTLAGGDMEVSLVVAEDEIVQQGDDIHTDLEFYIQQNYVEEPAEESTEEAIEEKEFSETVIPNVFRDGFRGLFVKEESPNVLRECCAATVFEEQHESRLDERINHIADTFSQYLLYLIQQKGMTNAEVWKRAIIDKKIFSKIKTNPEYHPQKLTALCLCIGARLNLDEATDLLARAGYALSPCDKTDIIFSYFIENEIYDMIELDIQLEEHGLQCIIS